MNYYEASKKLLTCKGKFHIELGLDRVSSILDFLGNPQDKIRCIHIAGTNGKGSVSSILAKILEKSGYNVGLFTSPHLVSYTERIKINSQNISDVDFYNILKEVDDLASQNRIHLTEFELLTVVAFVYFERKKVDFAVVEVGLGGRLDATNVISKPLLSIITSISLDHVDRLGDTIDKIAYEKAGIIKQGVECVIADDNLGLDIIKNVANEKNAQLVLAKKNIDIEYCNGKNFAIIDGEKYEFNLLGSYQADNLKLVLTAIWILRMKGAFIDETPIIDGLKTVVHPARFNYYPQYNLVVDGAHNVDAANKLRKALDAFFPNKKIIFIYSSLITKDFNGVISSLIKENDELVLYKFDRENACPLFSYEKYSDCKILEDSSQVLKLAQDALECNAVAVFTGSLYAIGEFYTQNITLLYSPTD